MAEVAALRSVIATEVLSFGQTTMYLTLESEAPDANL